MNRQELIDFCLTFPAAYEDYPFDVITDPGKWTVMRHGTNTSRHGHSGFIEAVTKQARGIAEKMDDFFVARLDLYEENMLHNVEGLPEGYIELAKHIARHEDLA